MLLAARTAGGIGDITTFDDPNNLQCYAGKAPVTRRSGKSELTVAHRLACNRYLADAVQQWAFTSLTHSGWAREFYDQKITAGSGPTRRCAPSATAGSRSCGTASPKAYYDEATHVANRNRALGQSSRAAPTMPERERGRLPVAK